MEFLWNLTFDTDEHSVGRFDQPRSERAMQSQPTSLRSSAKTRRPPHRSSIILAISSSTH